MNQLPRQKWAEYFDGPTGTWVGQQSNTIQGESLMELQKDLLYLQGMLDLKLLNRQHKL